MIIMKRKEKLKRWLMVLGWAGVIFGFSSMSINKQVDFNWWDFVIKKTAHMIEYAVLYFLVHRALSENQEKINKKVLIYSLILCLIYAFSDEWHQTFVAGREGTLRDVGFDSIGMLLSLNQIRRS